MYVDVNPEPWEFGSWVLDGMYCHIICFYMLYSLSYSCLLAGPTCIHASPFIRAVTSPWRYLESTMNDHRFRVASARASSKGRTSL